MELAIEFLAAVKDFDGLWARMQMSLCVRLVTSGSLLLSSTIRTARRTTYIMY